MNLRLTAHAKRAILVITAAFSLDVVLGWTFAVAQHISVVDGIYYAITTASTVGYGDIVPTTSMSRLVTVIMELTIIPLFAAAYSLLTAGLTTAKITERVTRNSRKHHEETLTKITEYIDQRNAETHEMLQELKEDPYWPRPAPGSTDDGQ